MGLSISASTMSRIVRNMGHDHDGSIMLWKKLCETTGSDTDRLPSASSSHGNESSNHSDCLLSGESSHANKCSSQSDRLLSSSSGESSHGNESSSQSDDLNSADPVLLGEGIQPSYILVTDNLDKNITPRFMTVASQVKSLHYVNSYGVLDRVPLPKASHSLINPNELPLSTFLLSPDDCLKLRQDYTFLVARILVNKLEYFSKFKKIVPVHLFHKYTTEMKKKSQIVSY